MKPITLVLSSYEANIWHLNLAPGARIDRIVLNGFYPQTITGAGSIPVQSYFNVGGSGALGVGGGDYAYAWPLSTGGSSTQGLLVGVENLLGTRVSSFTGSYQASLFSVTGSPDSQQTVNPLLGAGNLTDGAHPDLIYNQITGEVRIDLADLAAQYAGSTFNQQRLFLALANHDGTLNAAGFNQTDLDALAANIGFTSVALNANRFGIDGSLIRDYHGQLVSLGTILPPGISDASALRQYLAAARYATNQRNGDFDLFVVPEPNMTTLLLTAAAPGLLVAWRSRRPGTILTAWSYSKRTRLKSCGHLAP
jgi:hypothetical protein